MPKTDDIKFDSRRKSHQKPYLRHHSMVSLLERQLEEDQSTLSIHPHALAGTAKIIEVLAVEARAEGDAVHDADQAAEYYAYADTCESVASQLYTLVAKITANNNNADYPVPTPDQSD